jgi:DNA-binding NarL/FixJ family response regulator
MQRDTEASIRVVMILKADRLYSEVLRQFTLRVFPRAQVRLVATVEAAATTFAREKVDLFITGLGASLEGDVLELLGSAVLRSRAPRVIVVTARREYRVLAALRTLAVHGVFDTSTEPPEDFMTALVAVTAGTRYWSHAILEHMQRIGGANTALFRLLTAFEQIVLSVVGDGCDDSVAARELGVSPSTVSTVRRELHRKLGVQHRGELVRVAAQHGFVRFTPGGVVRPGFALLSAAYRSRKPRRTEPAASGLGIVAAS